MKHREKNALRGMMLNFTKWTRVRQKMILIQFHAFQKHVGDNKPRLHNSLKFLALVMDKLCSQRTREREIPAF